MFPEDFSTSGIDFEVSSERKSVFDSDDDSSAPSPRDRVWLLAWLSAHRFWEFMAVAAIGMLAFLLTKDRKVHLQYMPAPEAYSASVGGGLQFIGDAALGYPIYLGGMSTLNECTVIAMKRCNTTDPQYNSTTAASEACCIHLRDHKITPDETLSTPMLTLLSVGLPLAVLGAAKLLQHRGHLPHPDPQCGYFIGLYFSHCVALALTAFLKYDVGRPRPNYYALQYWTEYRHRNNLLPASELTHWHNHARSSFPSGHAATSAAGCVYLALCLVDLVNSLVQTGYINRIFTRTLVIYIAWSPGLLALWVAASRVDDYWHHYGDILVGLGIGAWSAYVAHGSVAPSVQGFRNSLTMPMVGEAYMEQTRENSRHSNEGILSLNKPRYDQSKSMPMLLAPNTQRKTKE